MTTSSNRVIPTDYPAEAGAALPRYPGPAPRGVRRRTPRDSFSSFGLLMIRLVVALVFIYHGGQIALHLWGGPGPVAFAHNHHWDPIVGWLVGLGQLGAGLSLITGLFFPLGTFIIAVVMAGAIATVHFHHGIDVAHGGMEYSVTLLVVALSLMLTGPGIYTIPAAFSGNHDAQDGFVD
ncbi:MAG: DoxX family protein [Armatimonadota bacterium]|nr:DoxX family protein [Armatimonadota bacterium]